MKLLQGCNPASAPYTCLPQVVRVNRQFYPLSADSISQSRRLNGDEYIVRVSSSCLAAAPGYLSSKHKNNRYPAPALSLSLPPTNALAVCLAWQQRKVNRMNKTYLNQNPSTSGNVKLSVWLNGETWGQSQGSDSLLRSTYKNAAGPIDA